MNTSKCKHCEKEFDKTHYNKIFCTKNCQEEFYREIKVYVPCILCGWNLITEHHHILWQANGGEDNDSNLVIVCPNHHRMLHNEKYREDIEQKIHAIINITDKVQETTKPQKEETDITT